MNLMAARDAAVKWNISQRQVAVLCAEGQIPGAQRVGNMWVIPENLENPFDGRSACYVNQKQPAAKPFLKWAGGKGQLLSEIRKMYPEELGKTLRKYAEPFVGGGAVLFDILNTFALDAVYISDTNAELINTYCMIRDEVDNLIDMLADMQETYWQMDDEARKIFYYEKRERFNALKTNGKYASNLERAALFIFLNRTCFNGLYRVNRKNLFNVPMGSYKKPIICDADNLCRVSKMLRSVTIVCGDFRQSADFIDTHTFVYFDPPYRPLNVTSSFTSYTENDFDDQSQKDLAQYVQNLDKIGARIVVSNSDPKNIDPQDTFFDELYSQQHIYRVSATRMINRNADARGKISELLIRNF